MNKFEKVSFDQFKAADNGQHENIEEIYKAIKLPKQGTKYSAGNDFYMPYDLIIQPGKTVTVPTGIRAIMDPDKFLQIHPRSSLGFKYRLRLDNTTGIVDADYSQSDNEGHIFVRMTNEGEKTISLKQGDAFVQGILLGYYTFDDAGTETVRNGGFGSTNNN